MLKIFIAVVLIHFAGCKGQNKITLKLDFSKPAAAPPVLVYKTKADYNNLVPVILSADKKSIISYPHPNDLKAGNGNYPLPALLSNGYLLDKRGIGPNIAFLNMTYKEFAALENAPSLQEMYDNIIDKDPLTELCNCGNKSAFDEDIEKQLNELIESNKLRSVCKVFK